MGSARTSRRGPWSPEEDNELIALVRSQGPNNWVRISQHLRHRSPKQCRERYHQNLKPSLNHDPISVAEGELIEQLVSEMGKRWAEIARRLGNRSDNAVKNWWNGSMNRRKRNPTQYHGVQKMGSRLHPIATTKALSMAFDHSGLVQASQHNHYSSDLCAVNRWSLQGSPISGDRLLRAPELRLESYMDGDYMASRFSQQGMPLHARSQYAVNVPHHSDSKPSMFYGEGRQSRLPPLQLPAPPTLPMCQPELYPQYRSEKSSVSPCISEFSYAYSNRPVPSLISDSQSTHSISPKTLASPHLNASSRLVDGHTHGISHDQHYGQAYRDPQSQQASSMYWLHQDASSSPYNPRQNEDKHYMFPNSSFTSDLGGSLYEHAITPRVSSFKDSRMNVASLVQ